MSFDWMNAPAKVKKPPRTTPIKVTSRLNKPQLQEAITEILKDYVPFEAFDRLIKHSESKNNKTSGGVYSISMETVIETCKAFLDRLKK